MSNPVNSGVQKRTARRRRGMEDHDRPTPLSIVSADAGALGSQTITVTFDLPVVLRGTPNWTVDVAGSTLTSATSPSPNVVELNFDVDISGATTLTIPPMGEAIRSKRGGWVGDSTFTI